MRAAKVIEAERRGQRLGYRTFGGKPSEYRSALIQDARKLKLIQGPQMTPLFNTHLAPGLKEPGTARSGAALRESNEPADTADGERGCTSEN